MDRQALFGMAVPASVASTAKHHQIVDRLKADIPIGEVVHFKPRLAVAGLADMLCAIER